MIIGKIGICKKCGRILTLTNINCDNCSYPLVDTGCTTDMYRNIGHEERMKINQELRNRYVLTDDNDALDEILYSLRESEGTQAEKELIQKLEAIIREHSTSTSTPNFTPNSCPKCGGTNWTPVRRKWSIVTGFMTNKIDMVCSNCGYTKKGQ